MENTSSPLTTATNAWPAQAQQAFEACQSLFHRIATQADVGPLDESLKWGQPAWRPRKPRTGSTLRLHWSEKTPTELSVYVDCKTDLAARMQTLYPDLLANDGRRRIVLNLNAPLPETALSHLAEMTFCYHRTAK
jgi:hypothetical protein